MGDISASYHRGQDDSLYLLALIDDDRVSGLEQKLDLALHGCFPNNIK